MKRAYREHLREIDSGSEDRFVFLFALIVAIITIKLGLM